MVKIIVLVKDSVDLTELRFDPVSRSPQVEGAKHKIGDLDKRALEAAIRLREKFDGKVITLSMGEKGTKTTLLEALAMGADAAYIVNDRLKGVDACASSKVLAAALEKMGDFDLILCGEMSLDSLLSQIGPRLAELLGLPQVTYAKELELIDAKLRAVRDLEDVDEIVEVELPVVVSVVREINEPRIPSLMNIMRARGKPTVEWDSAALGLSIEKIRAWSSIKIIEVKAPIVERKNIVIEGESVEEVANRLAEAIITEGVLEG